MAFCIFHNYCEKAADNGNCTKYAGTTRVNRGDVRCGDVTSLPEDKWAAKVETKKVNALKASKREAAGK